MAADLNANRAMPLHKINRYTVATVPSAVSFKDHLIIVTDAATNEIPCWSDGTNWKRFDTGATLS